MPPRLSRLRIRPFNLLLGGLLFLPILLPVVNPLLLVSSPPFISARTSFFTIHSFASNNLEFSSVFRDLDARYEASSHRKLISADDILVSEESFDDDICACKSDFDSILEALKEYRREHAHLILPRGHPLAKVRSIVCEPFLTARHRTPSLPHSLPPITTTTDMLHVPLLADPFA